MKPTLTIYRKLIQCILHSQPPNGRFRYKRVSYNRWNVWRMMIKEIEKGSFCHKAASIDAYGMKEMSRALSYSTL